MCKTFENQVKQKRMGCGSSFRLLAYQSEVIISDPSAFPHKERKKIEIKVVD
jgi:hypothetical protein